MRRGAGRRRVRQEGRPRAPADRHARTPQAQRPILRLPHPHGLAVAPPRPAPPHRGARLRQFAPPRGFRGLETAAYSRRRFPRGCVYIYPRPEMRTKRSRSVAPQARAETERAQVAVARLCPASPTAIRGT